MELPLHVRVGGDSRQGGWVFMLLLCSVTGSQALPERKGRADLAAQGQASEESHRGEPLAATHTDAR